MKKATIFLILIISIASCTNKSEGYKIQGHISGVENAKAVLWENKFDSGWTVIDSTRILNNEFTFEDILSIPKPYYLTISGVEGDALIIVENSNISLVINKNNLKEMLVTGSVSHKQYTDYTTYRNSNFDKKIMDLKKTRSIANQTKDSVLIDSINKQIDLINAMLIDNLKSYVRENNASVVAPFIVCNPPERNLLSNSDIRELLDIFDPSIEESNDVKKLESWHAGILNKTIGSPITHLIINDTIGNPISTSNLKGRYWLLDFWSSKCGPCRKGHPELKEVYKKFKAKGFEIYAVSFDSKRDEWIQAIKKDGIEWIQVCELNGWGNKARSLYSIEYIPQNLLVNDDGIIIASGLSAQKLENMLFEAYKTE